MQIVFQPQAKADLDYWVKNGNKLILKKITQLVESISEKPFSGIGKPEMLKHELSGLWSRRITQEHRIIYELRDEKVIIHSLKGHY